MTKTPQPIPSSKAKAPSFAALDQMYGYYAFAWQPFAPARSPVDKQAA
jgi:hypothetical protein